MSHFFLSLPAVCFKLYFLEPRRFYGAPWTVAAPQCCRPVIYALWLSADPAEEQPVYAGATAGLAACLRRNHANREGKYDWKYVSYIAMPEFEDPCALAVAEMAVVAWFRPRMNRLTVE